MDIKFILLIFLFFLGITNKLKAQKVFLNEAEISIDGLRKVNSNYGIKSSNFKNKVSLKQFCPKPGNQGTTGSCASFAAVHGAFTISNAIKNKLVGPAKVNSILLSSSYVYNQVSESENCSKGTSIIKTLDFLSSNGSCFETDFPFTEDCKKLPNEELKINESKFQIEFSTVLYDSKSSDIRKQNLIKSYLNDSIPVIAVCQIYNTFLELEFGTRFWEKNKRRDRYLGHHVMVVVGYDDFTGSFELMNSWGDDWAEGGFVKMSYEDFSSISTSGLILKLKTESIIEVAKRIHSNSVSSDKKLNLEYLFKPKSKQFISGTIKMKRIVVQDSILVTRTIPLRPSQDKESELIYDISMQELFQVELSDLGFENYFYMFSLEGNIVKQHWPRRTYLSEINMNLSSNSSIIVPDNESVFRLNQLDEKMVIFASNFELEGDPEEIYKRALNLSSTNKNIALKDNAATLSSYVNKNEKVVIAVTLKSSYK